MASVGTTSMTGTRYQICLTRMANKTNTNDKNKFCLNYFTALKNQYLDTLFEGLLEASKVCKLPG